jgi:hypothetical protein
MSWLRLPKISAAVRGEPRSDPRPETVTLTGSVPQVSKEPKRHFLHQELLPDEVTT